MMNNKNHQTCDSSYGRMPRQSLNNMYNDVHIASRTFASHMANLGLIPSTVYGTLKQNQESACALLDAASTPMQKVTFWGGRENNHLCYFDRI